MKIVIIGDKGQLGTDCIKVLSDEHEITGYDVPQIDIGDKQIVEQCILPLEPDVIINCAAYTAVDACETDSELAAKINGEGPGYLAQVAEQTGSRLVHISTDYVFSGKKPIPEYYVESDEVAPLSQYGVTKLAGEKGVQQYCDNHLILRTAWLYSGYGKNFLKTMLRLALSDPKREFKVVDDQYGSLTWSYTLARQIDKLLTTDLRGVMHTTSEGYSSWYEAACYFLDAMEVPYTFIPCTTAEYPTPAHRPANSYLENKVLKDQGLSLFVDWKDDVDKFVEQYRDQLLAEARKSLQ